MTLDEREMVLAIEGSRPAIGAGTAACGRANMTKGQTKLTALNPKLSQSLISLAVRVLKKVKRLSPLWLNQLLVSLPERALEEKSLSRFWMTASSAGEKATKASSSFLFISTISSWFFFFNSFFSFFLFLISSLPSLISSFFLNYFGILTVKLQVLCFGSSCGLNFLRSLHMLWEFSECLLTSLYICCIQETNLVVYDKRTLKFFKIKVPGIVEFLFV